jgi:hypothetical protein
MRTTLLGKEVILDWISPSELAEFQKENGPGVSEEDKHWAFSYYSEPNYFYLRVLGIQCSIWTAYTPD